LTKILIVSGLLLASQYSFAQIGYVRSNYSDAQLAAVGCDRNVLNRMEALAESRYNGQYNKVNELYVKQQVNASPKEATNSMLKCVDGALSQLDGLKNNVMGIYNMITGIGNMNLGALGAKALNQMTSMACNAVNSYTSGVAYNAVAPYNSSLTSIPNQIGGTIGTVDTPFGGVNVGSIVTNEVRQNAGATPRDTTFRDGTKTVLGDISNSPTPAPATPPIWK
jgi:hypothetical protein